MEDSSLSVLLIIGADRSHSIPLLKGLRKQTVLERLEIIIVDIAPEGSAPPAIPGGLDVRIVRQPGSIDWGEARAQAVREASNPLVAFLEDHTVPDRSWAQAVIEGFNSHGREVNTICYAFTNGSPDTYLYRSVFMAEYGALAHPLPEGCPPSTTANNIAYRRDMLTALGDKLGDLLEMDYFLQLYLGRDFKAMAAPGAIVSHQTNTHLKDLIPGHFGYARLFASRRIRHEGWSFPKRIAGTLATPFLVPALRLTRLFGALRGRSPLAWHAFIGLPVIMTLFIAGALGEAVGLLEGGEMSPSHVIWLELEAPRVRK